MARQRISVKDGKTTSPQNQNDDLCRFPSEIRIARRVDITKSVHRPHWDAFLNSHGEAMYGDGITYSLGSMAVTYVSAQELGTMLSDKFPQLYTAGNQVALRKTLISLSRDFKSYVTTNETTVTNILKNADDKDFQRMAEEQRKQYMHGKDDLDLADPVSKKDLDVSRLSMNKLWVAGRFAVRDVEPYKNGMDLGLSLSHPENDALRTEKNEIIKDFFGNKKRNFPVYRINTGFDPHLVFFRSFMPVSHLYVRNFEQPDEISLSAPEAIVNLKK